MSNCDPCKTIICEQADDFLVYNLQNPLAENPTDDPTGTTECPACIGVTCPVEFEDLQIYNLQTNIIFNTEPIIVTVPCPEGWRCVSTVTVEYPPGTFVTPDDPDSSGNYTAQGCLSLVSAPTPEQLFALLAAQQAHCDTTSNPPGDWEPPSQPPQPPPSGQRFTNEALSTVIPCEGDNSLSFTGTLPYGISVNPTTFTVHLAEGIYVSDESQAAANARAQQALDLFVTTSLNDGSLTCQEDFVNELQTINCPSGNADYLGTYNASIDGDGIYAINGTVYVAAGYWSSSESQAAANAAALAAGQARFDAAVATSQIECCPEVSLNSISVESFTAGSTVEKTFSGKTVDVVLNMNAACACSSVVFSFRYVAVPGGANTCHYLVNLPECATGKRLKATINTSGQAGCSGTNSPTNGSVICRVRKTGSGISEVIASAGVGPILAAFCSGGGGVPPGPIDLTSFASGTSIGPVTTLVCRVEVSSANMGQGVFTSQVTLELVDP